MKLKLKIWHKLTLAIISIVLMVLVIAMLLSQNSFRIGFLHYLNNLEKKRIDVLERQLLQDYQAQGNWNFLPQRHGWGRYVHDALRPKHDRPPRNRRHPPPPRRHESSFNNNQHRPVPPSRELHRPPRRPPPNPLHNLASKDDTEFTGKRGEQRHISLYSAEQVLISGLPQNAPDIIKRPIYFEKQLIAYLYLQPFKKLTAQLDQDFLSQQSRSFIKITFIAFVLAVLAAWLLAIYFKKRLAPLTHIAQQLTSGNYQYRASVKYDDELGQLADDLHQLGKTLAHNQTSRQQWIADISHELRTPLAILRGELEALQDGIRPLNQQSITSLVDEIQRLGKLVEDLYQLSLSDLGALHYVKEALDIHELLQQVVAFFEHRFAKYNITLSLQHDQSDTIIFGDEKRLFQLFSNLFENTVRYTDVGGAMHIHCYSQADKVIIQIEDSKPAVSDEQLLRLFDRLYRVEASRNRASGGAGLGLSIVKAVVDAHNATITTRHASIGGLAVTLEMDKYEP